MWHHDSLSEYGPMEDTDFSHFYKSMSDTNESGKYVSVFHVFKPCAPI